MDIEKENAYQIETMRENLKKLREKKNWSIKDLSELSGISETILKDIENGRDFGVCYLFRICSIYDIKPCKIFLPIKDLLP